MIDAFAELNAAIGARSLHDTLQAMYVDAQVPDLRLGVHLSDLTQPDTYRGKPRFCYRKIILSAHYMPEEKKIPHPRVAIFERGKDMHTRWQEKFDRAGYVIDLNGIHGIEATHEVQWVFAGRPIRDDDWRLLFTPDVCVDLKDGVGPRIVEIKGYNSTHYAKLIKTPHVPPEDATFQANLYMALTGIPHALIIVECKNDQRFAVWETQYNPDLVKPFEDRVLKVDAFDTAFKTSGALPQRVCQSQDDELARECPMRRVCFGSDRARYLLRIVRKT